jgi:Amt family ammonium transporter
MVGLLFNGLFTHGWVIGLDGVNGGYAGGFVEKNWKQLYIQFTVLCAGTAYAFVVSAILAKLVDLIPGLKLRASEEAELLGLDDDQHGEFSYDYVEVRRDFLAWAPHQPEQTQESKFVPQLGDTDMANMQKTGNSTSTEAEEKAIAEAE